MIVEDDPKWLSSIGGMYEDILGSGHVKITPIDSGREALELLENGSKYHLISLDINLGGTHAKDAKSGNPDIRQPGADGRAILRLAHKKHACNGVMLITGMHADDKLHFIWPDGHREWAALTLYLKTLFPGERSLYLPKNENLTPESNVDEYKKCLTKKVLLAMAKPQLVTIRCIVDDSYVPKIEIKESSRQGVFDGDNVARFIYELAVARNKNDFLSTQDVEELKGDYKNPTIFVDGIKRTLRQRGFNPDGILKKIRGQGWQLIKGVQTTKFPRPSHFQQRTSEYHEDRDISIEQDFDDDSETDTYGQY